MSYLRVISEVYRHVRSENDIRSTDMSYLRVISEVYLHAYLRVILEVYDISYLRVISEVYLHVISESDIRGPPTCPI